MTMESMLTYKMSQAGVCILQQASIRSSNIIRGGRGLLAGLPMTDASSALQEEAALTWLDEASCSPGADALYCIAVCTPLAYLKTQPALVPAT